MLNFTWSKLLNQWIPQILRVGNHKIANKKIKNFSNPKVKCNQRDFYISYMTIIVIRQAVIIRTLLIYYFIS